jgi:hypothetical protein
MVDVMVKPPPGMGLTPVVDVERTPVKVGERPDGSRGDVWACEDCPAVWRIVAPLPPPRTGYTPRGYDRWERLSVRAARRAVRRALTC